MKYVSVIFFLVISLFSMVKGQTKSQLDNVVITSQNNPTQVKVNEQGELLINVSPVDFQKFKADGFVR
jgi:biopolymer transport protein ExbD